MPTSKDHYKTAELLLEQYDSAVERRLELYEKQNDGESRLTRAELNEQNGIYEFCEDALAKAAIHANLALAGIDKYDLE